MNYYSCLAKIQLSIIDSKEFKPILYKYIIINGCRTFKELEGSDQNLFLKHKDFKAVYLVEKLCGLLRHLSAFYEAKEEYESKTLSQLITHAALATWTTNQIHHLHPAHKASHTIQKSPVSIIVSLRYSGIADRVCDQLRSRHNNEWWLLECVINKQNMLKVKLLHYVQSVHDIRELKRLLSQLTKEWESKYNCRKSQKPVIWQIHKQK